MVPVLAAALMSLAATPLAAQSLLERSPNLSGGWVGNSGQLYFNFLHRFDVSDAPLRKVTNFPTFTMAAALPHELLLGANYATSSPLAPAYPNEWEFFARYRPLSQADGAPLDLAVQAGYNLAAEGVDGELALARELGPVRPLLALRLMSDPFQAGATRGCGRGRPRRLLAGPRW